MSRPDFTRELALDMRAAYDAISPFIESHTSDVCPACKRVCCMDRHGEYEAEDLRYLEALGEILPVVERKALDTEACRHITGLGCGLPRWQRPFRCTWFFCADLLEIMPRRNPREYRRFIDELGRLQSLREELWRAGAE